METKTLNNRLGLFVLFTGIYFTLQVNSLPVVPRYMPPIAENSDQNTRSLAAATRAEPEFTYIVSNSPRNTFGYDIFLNGRLYIHQETVPALQVCQGFKNRVSAAKSAMLVIEKLKNGEYYPVLTLAEIKKIITIGERMSMIQID